MQIDENTRRVFEGSLQRCYAADGFLDRFYEIFLASSPKVQEKFLRTDFAKQKAALKASFDAMLRAAGNENTLENLLDYSAQRHSRWQLNIGAELYDLWLDSLLAAVQECDPEYGPEVQDAWEKVMGTGIKFLLSRY